MLRRFRRLLQVLGSLLLVRLPSRLIRILGRLLQSALLPVCAQRQKLVGSRAHCAGCKAAGGNCGFAYVDLGIAVGSAVAEAAIDMVDNRIMYSAGKAAEELYDSNVLWMGVPLSVSGKSIFFDRKPKT